MSLYLKYRPETLDDFAGNRLTTDALNTVLQKSTEQLPHTFLFTGASGCGKTTLARIVAQRLDCSDFDFKEMNSADFRGIDTVREIIRNMMLKPMKGTVRVWLIDECHQLSKDAQNALLKALEDTPKHVYFLLATTDPQKLLKTIQNRCMQFNVSPLPESRMLKLLQDVVKKEKKQISDEILKSVVQSSLGSPRAALVILDKIIDLSKDKISKVIDETARQENEVLDLCRALFKKNWKEISKILDGLREQEPENIRRAVLGYYSSVLVKSDTPLAYIVLDCFRKSFYDTGFSGLVMACYEVCQ
mgnify:CR=1 FL=1